MPAKKREKEERERERGGDAGAGDSRVSGGGVCGVAVGFSGD